MPLTIRRIMLSLLFLPLVMGENTDSRLGSGYSSIPLLRSGAGTNVVQVNVGQPAVPLRLTLSTNVNFVLVASAECEGCTQNSEVYNPEVSTSTQELGEEVEYTFAYPTGGSDSLTVVGTNIRDIILDARGDGAANQRMTLVHLIDDSRKSYSLSDGTAGFFGLGVYQTDPTDSFIPSEMKTTNEGAPSSASGFVVGFDIANSSETAAGTLHWGGVPMDKYMGDFKWIAANTTVGGGWGIPLDNVRVEGKVQSGSGLFATLDPGFDAIYMPSRMAEAVFADIPGARRDRDPTRWNLPCNTNLSMSVAISGTTYDLAPSQLVRRRGNSQTCWSSIIAWTNGSVPEQLGEVRLGTPFLSGIYSASYYSEDEQLVGIASKQGTLAAAKTGRVNKKLAGILIGTLVGALAIVLLLMYARNRSSFQSIYYRAIRREQRFHVNALVRGATLPPPMIPIPQPIPGPYPAPFPPYAPRYDLLGRRQRMPLALQLRPRGFYSRYRTPRARWGPVRAVRLVEALPAEPRTLSMGGTHPPPQTLWA